MTNFDLTPVDSNLDGVRLYGDSMEPIERGQQHQINRHDTISGTPGSKPTGLEPGEVRLRGTWLGSKASDLADRLRSILDDQDVEQVEIAAVNTTDPLDGTYNLAEEERLDQTVAGNDESWEYALVLIED